jgi:hypothetical protein
VEGTRRIFVGYGIAEVNDDAVALELRRHAVISAHDVGADLPVISDQVAQVLGIELARDAHRVDQVTEDHRHLTPLSSTGMDVGGRLRRRGHRWPGGTE